MLYFLQQSSCSYYKSNCGAQMSSWININSGYEQYLQIAVAYVGPAAVAVDADNKAFRVRTFELHVKCSVVKHSKARLT